MFIEKAGFNVEDVWGYFYGNDYDSSSEHLIFLAKKNK